MALSQLAGGPLQMVDQLGLIGLVAPGESHGAAEFRFGDAHGGQDVAGVGTNRRAGCTIGDRQRAAEGFKELIGGMIGEGDIQDMGQTPLCVAMNDTIQGIDPAENMLA